MSSIVVTPMGRGSCIHLEWGHRSSFIVLAHWRREKCQVLLWGGGLASVHPTLHPTLSIMLLKFHRRGEGLVPLCIGVDLLGSFVAWSVVILQCGYSFFSFFLSLAGVFVLGC